MRQRGRSFILGVVLVEMWACGVNSATHHWADAAGELLAAILGLFVWNYWPEIKTAVRGLVRR